MLITPINMSFDVIFYLWRMWFLSETAVLDKVALPQHAWLSLNVTLDGGSMVLLKICLRLITKLFSELHIRVIVLWHYFSVLCSLRITGSPSSCYIAYCFRYWFHLWREWGKIWLMIENIRQIVSWKISCQQWFLSVCRDFSPCNEIVIDNVMSCAFVNPHDSETKTL